jgi:hypothetical protein
MCPRKGKQGRARAGKVVPNRSAPLGFEYDPEVGNYRVVPEKMAIVRRIFEEVGVKGHSMRSVKLALEADGIKPPGYERALAAGQVPSKYWSVTTIRRIITNDVYLGTQWYNRTRVERNPDATGGDNKYHTSINPREDWIAVSVPDSGIPKEWIEAARALVEQNIKPTNKGRRPWELKGHLFCECGVRMTTHTTTRKGRKVVYYYYVCNRHKHDGKGACPYARYHEAEELEHRVERVVLDLVRRPEVMLEQVEQYIAELPEIIHEDPERKSSHLKEIYRKLGLKVLVRESGELVITGAFGTRNLAADDPGPFIGMSATYELDSEAYTWTDVPAPDDPFWDTWREGEQVVRVWRKSPSSRWGTRPARPAATCTTGV